MSILARFSPAGLTRETYDQVSEKLEASDWPPAGLQLHVAFGDDGDLKVSEIWESREQMEAFGERLMPVLEEAGVQMAAEPQFFDVHRFDKY
jgi:D-mannonate dehydratase